MISKLAALVSRVYALLNRLECIPVLLVRIVLGIMFAQGGYPKLFTNHAGIVSYFTELRIPFPALNAWFIAGLEFFGGMLLVVGLGTRVVAALLASTMLVATVTAVVPGKVKSGEYTNLTDAFFIPEVLALLMLVWLVFSGPRTISLDHLLKKKLAPAPKPPA